MTKPATIECPTCKRAGDWFAGAYGPFCSRRCKLVDLGKWLNEEHLVSQPLQPEDVEDAADFPTTDGDDPPPAA